MAENETRLNSNLFKQYQKFGFDIMEYLADFFEKAELEEIDEQAVNSLDGRYQRLTFPDQSYIRYTSWNDAKKPFYINLYNSRGGYILELDLTRLVCIEDRFTWYLAMPKNPESREVLAKQLDFVQTPSDYRAWVTHQKMMLKQGKQINKEGFLLAEDSSWKELVEKLAALIQIHPKNT
ncbi:hypothetical protein BHC47_10255 [Snodgrassella alvi]|uniref:Uncharacterized protein n=1 Tax=Snodgrassella alvi TaxID=1196083 RepID=A0A2N9Y6E1_9NEIS|nr:hypothetical protein [Snodgrassella alvi]PIT64366.1 hypothetical protein BHC47_10255 [Snodgrassella alvi]PIT65742.1 hypothetical protein BHC56_10295 [Snodgrassella alvi]